MRMILSIPQQIQRALLSGDLDKSLEHLRMAVARDEMGVVTEELKAVCLANVLRMEHLKGRLTTEGCAAIADRILALDWIPLAATLVLIRLRRAAGPSNIPLPPLQVLETLDVLASDTQTLSDRELCRTAALLSA
jgi:hypothetical protein